VTGSKTNLEKTAQRKPQSELLAKYHSVNQTRKKFFVLKMTRCIKRLSQEARKEDATFEI
jgi:hypothetical protein